MAKCARSNIVVDLMDRTAGAPSRIRRRISRMRQDSGDSEPPVRGYAVTHPHGPVILPRAEGWDQLIYAASGVMTVHTGDGVWVVPPDRAVWVPSGVGQRIDMAGRGALRLLAEGEPVTRVAHAVGYATPSAFGAMFVRQLGVSPARYFSRPTNAVSGPRRPSARRGARPPRPASPRSATRGPS